jgi:WS/DGAT/MGAT family acyltransferase
MSYTYDRLSAQDNSFLLFETHSVHMHVSSTLVFDSGPLQTEGGGIDIDAIRNTIVGSLHHIPRYRQRLHQIPLENHAVWVDDPHFDIDYHLRHTALPRPGTPEQLKKLAARIMAQQLDRKRPLWETWVAEGLNDGNGFAMITKIHHCMIDGASGVDLAYILLSPSPEVPPPPEPPRFYPRPAPTRRQLMRDEFVRRLSLPLQIFRGVRSFVREADDVREEIAVRARAVIKTMGMGMSAGDSPLNGKVGPHRAFDYLQVPLDELKAVRKAWDCSINDVVLTIVTGAVRDYLRARSIDPARLDFRVATPVSVRSEEERGQLGNRVSSWIIALPIGEGDPKKQLDVIRKKTQELKESRQALGVEMMMKVAEWTPSTLLSLGAQAMSGPINTIVTNVPGPQIQLYCSGAPLRGIYPQVPLMENMGMGIALISYAGTVNWGFNFDPELVPDADVFIDKVRGSLESVRRAAGLPRVRPAEKPAREQPAPAPPATAGPSTRH